MLLRTRQPRVDSPAICQFDHSIYLCSYTHILTWQYYTFYTYTWPAASMRPISVVPIGNCRKLFEFRYRYPYESFHLSRVPVILLP